MIDRYTVTLKKLLDNEETKPLIDKALSTYPLYEAAHKLVYAHIPTREELNKKILNAYKYREIGFETVGRFIDELEISMNEIMPYYNSLYKSIDMMNELDNIFENVDIEELFDEQREGTSKGSSEGSSKGTSLSTNNSEASSESKTTANTESYNKNVESNTPQSDISTQNTDIDNVSYADKITWNHNNSNDSATNTGTDTTNSNTSSSVNNESAQETNEETTGSTTHTLKRKGNQGVNTYAHDLLEFRELFVNIEQQIINDRRIRELFMQIW